MKKILSFAITALFVLSSCTDRLVDFTVISTKNVPIGQGYSTQINKAEKRVTGKDKKSIVLGIPFGSPNLKTAIDRAIESYPGAIGLADGVVKAKYWSCFFYGQSGYVVEGTPIYEYREGANTTYGSPSVGVAQPQQGGLLFFHEVKSGETLSDIAKTYNVSVADIIKWNSLSDTSNIKAGTKLKVQVR